MEGLSPRCRLWISAWWSVRPGTCYVADYYFHGCGASPLFTAQAIEEKFVKKVEYVGRASGSADNPRKKGGGGGGGLGTRYTRHSAENEAKREPSVH